MEKLEFLFIAEMGDGGIYQQDPFDKSKFGGPNAFSDIKDKKIKKFSLIGKGHIFTIDLVDGHAEIDGTKIYAPAFVYPGANLKLVYYSEAQQSTIANFRMDKAGLAQKLTAVFTGKKDLPVVRRFYIGWEYVYKGKNHRWVMGVN